MLSVKFIRENREIVERAISLRNKNINLDDIISLDEKRREYLSMNQKKKQERNQVSKKIGELKRNNKDASKIIKRMTSLSSEIKRIDHEIAILDDKLKNKLLLLPNILSKDVPEGDEADALEIRCQGSRVEFPAQYHWDIGVKKDIIDFQRGVKISGSSFYFMKGKGALLERAIYNFMLDTHRQRGYTELCVPIVVNRDSMLCTGQFPKFEDEYYTIESDELSLIPTAEVSITNYYRGEILLEDDLPKYFTALTPCFRREAGAAGKDTRGLIRVHQFNKVELVKFVKPEDSEEEHLKLLDDAENILRLLGLPYRVVILASHDISNASYKTYDIEIWMPALNRYLEVSSCSNFLTYQSLRGMIRFKRANGSIDYLHTLNSSGLAVGRTLIGIMENFQDKEGNIIIPEVLRKYTGFDII